MRRGGYRWPRIGPVLVTVVLATVMAGVTPLAPPALARGQRSPASDAGVLVWGSDQVGQLGDGEAGGFRVQPAAVPGLSGIVELAAGTNVFAARDSDGGVWGWGENEGGVLLLGHRIECGSNVMETVVARPRQLPLPGSATAIDVGRYHGLAVVGGQVVEWGDSGYRGCEDTEWYSQAVTHPFPTNVIDVAASVDTNLALTADGKVYSWNKSETPELLPELSNIVSIDAGVRSQVALASDGTVYTWTNKYDSAFTDSDCLLGMFGAIPNRPTALPMTGISAVSMSFSHTLALKRDGSVFAFGLNTGGQPNNSDRVLCVPTLMDVAGVTQVAAGGQHSLVALSNGDVVGWGSNAKGQLAVEPVELDRKLPPTRLPISNVQLLAAGNEVSAAVTSNTPDVPDTRRIRLTLREQCNSVNWQGTITREGSRSELALTVTVRLFEADSQVGEVRLAPGQTALDIPTSILLSGETRALVEWGTQPLAASRSHILATDCDRYVYVAMGDSYSSGEGTFDYDTDSIGSACHRGPLAWPRLLQQAAESGVDAVHHLACSGAVTRDLFENNTETGATAQVLELERLASESPIGLVTLTIGGNDLGFSDIIAACRFTIASRDCTDGLFMYEMYHKTEILRRQLATVVYPAIKQAAGSARVVVVGYPRLFPQHDSEVVNCEWLTSRERSNLNLLAGLIDAQLLRATQQAGAEYISVLHSLDGHELCTPQSWVAPILAPPSLIGIELGGTEQGHPIFQGQEAISEKVRSTLLR